MSAEVINYVELLQSRDGDVGAPRCIYHPPLSQMELDGAACASECDPMW